MLFIQTIAFSQVEIGLKLGLHNNMIEGFNPLNTEELAQNIDMSINDAEFGFHAGVFARFKIGFIFIEPAVLLNSNSVLYDITRDSLGVEITDVKREYYQSLDIPVMVGVKLAFLNIHAGPVAHIHLNSTSELFDIDGYSQRFKNATFGYQAGIGVDINKLRIDLNYEGNFDDFGSHITFDDTNLNFAEAPSRLILSIGVRF